MVCPREGNEGEEMAVTVGARDASQGTMKTGNSESEVAHMGNGVRIRDRTKQEELGACRNTVYGMDR